MVAVGVWCCKRRESRRRIPSDRICFVALFTCPGWLCCIWKRADSNGFDVALLRRRRRRDLSRLSMDVVRRLLVSLAAVVEGDD